MTANALFTAVRGVVVAFTLISFTACTTLRPLESSPVHTIRDEVKVGDHVVIEGINGRVYELDVLRVDSDSLLGTSDTHKQYKIAYAAIKTVKVRRFSFLKTTGLVVVSLATIIGIAYVCIFGCSVRVD